ncbi:MAG: trypsin-like peptidase domain-containing protein [Candidatus Taylorbacteria bacterium]|nr:trypsin-like peptidase domain-containing protein [Candidatus Taylorbacteria bacterium]
MENLTKQQIVLLTLFVSFVTSMATGIFTVSLMDQAPQGVTQTINRVVERTVERVVPAEPAPAAVVKAPVFTYEDVTAAATQKAMKSTVKIIRTLANAGEIIEGYGVIVAKDGKVATDRIVTAVPGSYFIVTSDGVRYPAEVINASQGSDIAFLTPSLTEAQKKTTVFTPVTFVTSANIKLGATLLLLGGTKEISVYQGIIQNVQQGSEGTSTVAMIPKSISFSNNNHALSMGSSLFSLSGEFVGMKTQSVNSEVSNEFLPAPRVLQVVSALNVPKTATSSAAVQ